MKKVIKYRFGIIGLSLVIVMVITSLFAPLLAPHGPYEQDITKRFIPPFWHQNSDKDHLLGTDHVGRDLLSRIIYGARISVSVGIFSVLIAATIGIVLGSLAGYYLGILDTIICFLIDVMLSLPYILLALALVATLGASFRNVFIVLGVTSWPLYARVVRTEMLRIKEMDYVKAAKAIGMRDLRILLFEIFPNMFNTIVVIATIKTATMIIAESFFN